MTKDFCNFLNIFFKKYFFLGIYLNVPRGLAVVSQLISLPIILASLSIADYGLFQLVLVLQAWLEVLTANQITRGAKRGIAQGLDGTFLYAIYFRLKLFLFVLVLGMPVLFFLNRSGHTELSILIILMVVFFILGNLPKISLRHFLFAKKRFKAFAVLESIITISVAIGGTIAAFFTGSIFVYAITRFSIIIIISLSALFYVIVKYKIISALKEERVDKDVSSYGIKMVPGNLILIFSDKMPNIIITLFFGIKNLAVFAIAEKLDMVLKDFLNSSNNLFYADFAKSKWKDVVNKVNKNLKRGLMLSALIVFGVVVLGYGYISFFFPPAYQPVKIYLLILGFGLPPLVLQGVMKAVLEANFRHKELTLLIALPSLIKVCLIIIFGIFGGIIGILLGMVVGNWISFLLYYLLTIKTPPQFKHFLKKKIKPKVKQAVFFVEGEKRKIFGKKLSLKELTSNDTRYDYFLIWGHGLKHKKEIIEMIRENSSLEIKRVMFYKIKNVGRFIKKTIYGHDYAPFWHLRAKTKYLLKLNPNICIIFVLNKRPQEVFSGEGFFKHIESQNIKELKTKIRNKFNPRKDNQRTEDHIIHASDNEFQTDHLMKSIGFAKGVKYFKNKPNSILSLPNHISSFNSFELKKVKPAQLYVNILKGAKNKFSKEVHPLKDSPHYKYLKGDKKIYQDYLDTFSGYALKDDYSTEKFELLFRDSFYLEGNYYSSYILVEEIESNKYLILDGLHRASKLLFQNKEEIIVALKLKKKIIPWI